MEKKFNGSRFFVWLAVIGVVGALLVLFLTRKWGLGVTAGSMLYVEAARNFVAGSGFSLFSKGGTLEPLGSFPPGFPFVLSWGWFLGMDAFHWARLLNAFFFGVNIFLAGVLAWSWSRNKIAGFIAAGLFLCSPQLLDVHLHLLVLPIILGCVLSFFIALSRYEENGGKGMFYAAACTAALAGLMKPLEFAFVLTAWEVFFSAKGDAGKGKGFRALLFLLIATGFSVIWHARNIVLGTPVLSGQPFSLQRLYGCLDTASIYLLPSMIPDIIRWGVMGLAITGGIVLLRGRKKAAGDSLTPVAGLPVAFLFMGSSLLLYLFIMPLIVQPVGSCHSVLSPALALGLVILACLVVRTDLEKVIVVVVILFALGSFARSVNLAVSFFRDGRGYSSKAWTESKVLKELRAVDERVMVYTNAPEAVYYLIGRPSMRIPLKSEDDGFFPSVSTASRMFDKRTAVGVIFNEKHFSPGARWSELQRRAALKNVMSDSVVSLYVQKKAGGTGK